MPNANDDIYSIDDEMFVETEMIAYPSYEHPEVVMVYTSWDGFVAAGVSRRHPNDREDRALAVELAMGRAVRQLGRNILRDAHARIKYNDDARAAQEAAARAHAMRRQNNARSHRRQR